MAYTAFNLKIDLVDAQFTNTPQRELIFILGMIRDQLELDYVEGFIHDSGGKKIGAWSIDDDTAPTSLSIQKYL